MVRRCVNSDPFNSMRIFLRWEAFVLSFLERMKREYFRVSKTQILFKGGTGKWDECNQGKIFYAEKKAIHSDSFLKINATLPGSSDLTFFRPFKFQGQSICATSKEEIKPINWAVLDGLFFLNTERMKLQILQSGNKFLLKLKGAYGNLWIPAFWYDQTSRYSF